MAHPQGGSLSAVSAHELAFGVLVFVEGGKLDNPETNPWSKDKNQDSTHICRQVQESNPGHSSGR